MIYDEDMNKQMNDRANINHRCQSLNGKMSWRQKGRQPLTLRLRCFNRLKERKEDYR